MVFFLLYKPFLKLCCLFSPVQPFSGLLNDLRTTENRVFSHYTKPLPDSSNVTRERLLFRGLKTASFAFKMAAELESLAKGREVRRNAGSLMSKLIEDEQEVDDFYKTAFGGFEEVSDDEQYETEDEEKDVVDSDFSISETDEVVEDVEEEEPKRNKKKQLIKPYKAPKKDGVSSKPSNAQRSEAKKRKSFEDEPREGVRKSTRSLTVERAQETRKRFKEEREKKTQLKQKQQRRLPDARRLTQEELLAEAKVTEEENIASLKAYHRLEADKKKTKIQKVAFKGSVIRFHSLSMPVIEVSEPVVKVDDNEEDDVTVDSSKRCCRNFLIFTDAKAFPQAYFPSNKPKVPQRTYCPVTGLPARYRDPITGLPFSSAHAFRYIRERYALQLEEMKEKAAEMEQRRRRKPQ